MSNERDTMIELWQTWSADKAQHERIIFTFYREVIEPSPIERDLIETYEVILDHLHQTGQ